MRLHGVIAQKTSFYLNRITDMRRLTTGIRSEKRVVRRFRRCANVIECTYTNLDSIAYYTPRLYDIFIDCIWVVTRWKCTFTHKQYTEQHK